MQELMKKKKGQALGLNNLAGIAIAIGVAVIVFMIVFSVVDSTDDSFTAGSFAANASTEAQEGLANITSQFPTIGVVIGGVVIIGLVVAGFAFSRR